jgi:ferric-dicitrate binding protein FerR (iron transport regulator)
LKSKQETILNQFFDKDQKQNLSNLSFENDDELKKIRVTKKALNNIKREQFVKSDFLSDFDSVEKRIHKPKAILQYLKYASIIIFIVSVSWLGGYFSNSSSSCEERFTLYKTNQGECSNVILPDGTKLYLFENTEVKLSNKYSKKNRKLSIIGKAYFDVTKDKKSIFLVNSGKYKLRVLGTKFNLEAYPNKNIVASLDEGLIEIDLENYNKKRYMVRPNSSLMFNPKTKEINLLKLKTNFNIDWKKNRLVFNNTPFIDVVKELTIFYNTKIELKTNKLNNIDINGDYENMNLDQVLKSLNRIVDFTITNDTNGIVLTN